MANNEITDASNLFISIDNELRPWSDVSQDIISYLRTKVENITNSLVYRGSVESLDNLYEKSNKPISDPDYPKIGDMWNVVEDSNNNYAWNGLDWDSLGPLAATIDSEAIENSENAIQSGFIYNALLNYATYSQIQAIIDEVFGGQSIDNITTNINRQFSDISQDISDLQASISNIPDPLVSRDMNNAITRGTDNGLFVTDKTAQINQLENIVDSHTSSILSNSQRITSLENGSTVGEVTEIKNISDNTENITINSDNVMYYKASGNVNFNFTPSNNPNDFAEKYIYIESENDINLSVTNAEWSMIQEEPTFYSAGYYLLAKVIWIGGIVIIETIDVNQMPDEIVPNP